MERAERPIFIIYSPSQIKGMSVEDIDLLKKTYEEDVKEELHTLKDKDGRLIITSKNDTSNTN